MTHRAPLRISVVAVLLTEFVVACSPGFQSTITPIKSPTSFRTSHQEGGLQIGFHFLSSEEQVEHFGVDMTEADIVPVRFVVRNDDASEFYIQAEQIFGKTAGGDLYPAYRLDQSIERIRRSEIGEAMARGAAAGILIGAAVGAAAGAAIGDATGGDAGAGAAVGAATLGTAGGLSGASASVDSTTHAIKKELRNVAWGNRVVYAGRTEHGFLFMKPNVPYEALEVLIYNVNARENSRVTVQIR